MLLTDLKALMMASNRFSATIHENLSALSMLTVIEVFGNSLSGCLPESLGSLTVVRGL